ncbi:MAG: GntR family transcriptional regulator [Actinomycetota bacterium]|nr:GntR family transcriptional regulator [Actinomycetota bacterium]
MTDGPAAQTRAARSTLAANVHRQLKADIIACRALPGAMLAASQLAERFQVSQSPVHEALKTLCREGFLRVLPRVGYIVTPVSGSDVDEIFDLRLSLEVFGAGQAAQRVTDQDLARLREQHARALQNVGRGSLDDPAHLESVMAGNRQFHTMIATLSGNHRLSGIVGGLLDEGQRIYFLYCRPGRSIQAQDPHEDIVRALASRDPGAARAAMAAHIEAQRRGTHLDFPSDQPV